MSRPSHRPQVEAALPGTLGDISERSGVQLSTVVRWLRIMRDAGECHIGGWERTSGTGGPIKAVYVLGPGKDAKCTLKRLSTATYSARHRAKTRKDGRREHVLAKNRSDYWADRAKVQGDPLILALFGRAPAASKEAA